MKARTAVKVVWGSVVFCTMMMRDRRRADRARRARRRRDAEWAQAHALDLPDPGPNSSAEWRAFVRGWNTPGIGR